MERWESWLVILSTGAAATSGWVLYIMKNWMTSADPFAVVGHPWQPLVLKTHLIATPVMIFAVGLVFSSHILTRLHHGRRGGRISGVAALGLFAPVVLSGVLIQMIVNEGWLAAAVWVHLLSGSVYAASILLHRWVTPRRNGNTARPALSPGRR